MYEERAATLGVRCQNAAGCHDVHCSAPAVHMLQQSHTVKGEDVREMMEHVQRDRKGEEAQEEKSNSVVGGG